jgi:hypothetical protein
VGDTAGFSVLVGDVVVLGVCVVVRGRAGVDVDEFVFWANATCDPAKRSNIASLMFIDLFLTP